MNYYINKRIKVPSPANTIISLVFWMLLAVCFIYLETFLYQTGNGMLDSDAASELLLSEMLASEKRLITPNWYYSTELRVLNTQLVFAPLFVLSGNWQLVRVVGIVILHLILLFCAYYLCKKLQCTEYFPAVGIMLILPISTTNYSCLLQFPYYIPHIAISFIAVGLVIAAAQNAKNGCNCRKKLFIIFACAFLLAFIAGLGGARLIITCYLPLALCALILVAEGNGIHAEYANRGLSAASIISLTGATLGFLVNTKVLSQIYHFHDYELSLIDFDFDRIGDVLRGILASLGFVREPLNASSVISNVVCAVVILVFIFLILKGLNRKEDVSFEYRFLTLYVLCAAAVLILLYAVTDMYFTERYCVPLTVFVGPVVAVGLQHTKNKAALLACLWIFLIAAQSHAVFSLRDSWSRNAAERMEIVDRLEQCGYRDGYATFWNANVFTALSNGAIRIHSWGDEDILKKIDDVDVTGKWLQPVAQDYEVPSGKVFLIFGSDQLDSCRWRPNLSDEDRLFHSKHYDIFGYESYEELCSMLYDYEFTFDDPEYLLNGIDANGIRIVYPDGIFCGPYIRLNKGIYIITVLGTNLSNADAYCSYNSGKDLLQAEALKASDTEISYRIVVPDDVTNAETVVINRGEEDLMISKLFIDCQL